MNREFADTIEEVTRDIANVFAVNERLQQADVEQLHHKFVACVRTVNARLLKCDELLRRGLRAEALQEAEAEPLLLDLVTQLDIPEWDLWADYVRTRGIAPQPSLLLDVAAHLNESYGENQPLERLLRLHRLHALGRSPPVKRINILRELAAVDSSNLMWVEDLRVFEKARIDEIESEFKTAEHECDLAKATSRAHELNESIWIEEVPKRLVADVQNLQSELEKANARDRLLALVEPINQAFSAMDLRRGLEAKSKWHQLAAAAELTGDEEVLQQVSAAFDWITDELADKEKHAAAARALKALELGLDDDQITRTELEKRFHALHRMNREIPTALQNRYERRLDAFDRHSKRQTALRALSIVAVVLLVGSVTLVVLSRRAARRDVQNATVRLSGFLENGQLHEASRFADQLEEASPRIHGSVPIQELIVKLDAAEANNANRLEQVEILIGQASNLMTESPTWDAVLCAEESLEKAEALGTDTEVSELLRAQGRVRDARVSLQARVDAEFREGFESIKKDLENVADLSPHELDDLVARIELLQGMPRVSRILRQSSQLPAILKRIKQRIASSETTAQRDSLLRRVRAAIGKRVEFKWALEAYIRRLTDDPRTDDFQGVLSHDLAYLDTVDEWNRLTEEWKHTRVDSDGALTLIRDLQKQFTDYPRVERLSDLRGYLEDKEKRDASAEPPLRQLEEMLTHEWFAMKSMKLKNGGRYYFFEEPKQSGKRELEIEVIRDAIDSTVTEQKTVTHIAIDKTDGTSFYADSPQAKFAIQAIAKLRDDKLRFETKILHILDELYEKSDIDTFIQALFLQLIAEIGANNSSLLADALDDFRSRIATDEDLATVNWLDPEDQEVARLRAKVAAQLDRLPPRDYPSNILRQIEPKLRRLDRKVSLPRLDWVGALLLDDGGSWQLVHAEGTEIPKRKNLGVRHFSDDGTSSFKKIGRWDGGLIVEPGTDGLLVQGKPVYIFREQ